MVKITPSLLVSWEKLVPRLGERDAADALGASQSGMRGARDRRDHAPERKDRRGKERALKPALRKRIHKFKEQVKLQCGNPTAKYVKRKLKIRGVSVRTLQRELRADGDKYRNRPAGKHMTDTEMQARVKHCTKRLQMRFVYRGPASARGAKRGIDCYMDCHSVEMPLEKAPLRSQKTWFKNSEKHLSHIQGKPKKRSIIPPSCKLFGGCFPRNGKQFVCSFAGTFTTEVLLILFKRVVTPALRRNAGPGPWRVVCDGDGAFKSTAFQQYCDEVGIIKVDHPAGSPDLNPEENVWSECDRHVEQAVMEDPYWRKGAPGTGQQVKQSDKDRWDGFVKTQCRKVAPRFILNATSQQEMEERCCLVIAHDGARIPK